MYYIFSCRSIKNAVDDYQMDTEISSSVETLHLIKCDISDWNIAVLLRRLFPACKSLVLCENPIKTIEFNEKVSLFFLNVMVFGMQNFFLN